MKTNYPLLCVAIALLVNATSDLITTRNFREEIKALKSKIELLQSSRE